jgi:hypothetical protein
MGPDGSGVALYRDRPEGEWPRNPDGGRAVVTHRLGLDGLLRDGGDPGSRGPDGRGRPGAEGPGLRAPEGARHDVCSPGRSHSPVAEPPAWERP